MLHPGLSLILYQNEETFNWFYPVVLRHWSLKIVWVFPKWWQKCFGNGQTTKRYSATLSVNQLLTKRVRTFRRTENCGMP
jgi:hypothetical protein